MRSLFRFLFVTIIELYVFRTFQEEEKRFIVVSGFDRAVHLYSDVLQNKRLGTQSDDELDISIDTRERICEDVTSAYSIRKLGIYPYKQSVNCFCHFFSSFNYPNETIRVSTILRIEGRSPIENVFVCLARRDCCTTVEFYISKEYNLLSHSYNQSNDYIAGHFIFTKFGTRAYLWGLAELPAKVFISPDFNVEHLYLQRRSKYSSSQNRKDDPLCKFAREDLSAFCVAIFNSRYFEEKLVLSHTNEVIPRCEFEAISFQTEFGKAEAGKRKLKEWMVTCESRPFTNNESEINYAFSHAYESNQIFVYTREGDFGNIFLENLSTNIRLSVDPSSISYRESDDDELPVSLQPIEPNPSEV